MVVKGQLGFSNTERYAANLRWKGLPIVVVHILSSISVIIVQIVVVPEGVMVGSNETDRPGGGKFAAIRNRFIKTEKQGRGKKKTKYYFNDRFSRNSIIFLSLALLQGRSIGHFCHTADR